MLERFVQVRSTFRVLLVNGAGGASAVGSSYLILPLTMPLLIFTTTTEIRLSPRLTVSSWSLNLRRVGRVQASEREQACGRRQQKERVACRAVSGESSLSRTTYASAINWQQAVGDPIDGMRHEDSLAPKNELAFCFHSPRFKVNYEARVGAYAHSYQLRCPRFFNN